MIRGRITEQERRRSKREVAARKVTEARDKQLRASARVEIQQRLAEVPASWRQRYRALLAEHGLTPGASIASLTLPALRARVALLPPRPVYVHMRNAQHPSLPEPRVWNVTIRKTRSRASNKQTCSNRATFSPSLMMVPDRPNIAKIHPRNLVVLHLPNGHEECVNVQALRQLHKNGFVLAQTYQRDAHGDHWAEMLVDTYSSGPVRVPLWLLERATGMDWELTVPRRKPPHETTYA